MGRELEQTTAAQKRVRNSSGRTSRIPGGTVANTCFVNQARGNMKTADGPGSAALTASPLEI